MAAKKTEQLQLAQDWGDWKAGDVITREQAGDQFEAMNAAGVFSFAPDDPRSTLKPDVAPPPAAPTGPQLTTVRHEQRGTITATWE